MRLIILGSGSSGNALYVESGALGADRRRAFGKGNARRMTAAGHPQRAQRRRNNTRTHRSHERGSSHLDDHRVPVFMSEATRVVCPFPEAGAGITWSDDRLERPVPDRLDELPSVNIPHDGVARFAVTVESEGVKSAS